MSGLIRGAGWGLGLAAGLGTRDLFEAEGLVFGESPSPQHLYLMPRLSIMY